MATASRTCWIGLFSAAACWTGAIPVLADETVVHAWNLDADPGWAHTGEWAFGPPIGEGGLQYGHPDPTTGYTGTNVYGVNLTGDHAIGQEAFYSLIAGPIDCSGMPNVTLRFRRWLNMDSPPSAFAFIQVSSDGVNWSLAWYNQAAVSDSEWVQVSYNISAMAANAPAVYVQWNHYVRADARPHSGWNIDDIEIVQRDIVIRPEHFRGLWADAFHDGFATPAQIEQLVNSAVAGNYNAILPEVMAYQDETGAGHGAYWASNVVPRATDNGRFDSLGYLIQRAHAKGLEVHAWLIPYRVCKSWPPKGNPYLEAHPEFFMTNREGAGSPGTIGGAHVLDPGCPEAQEYLVSIVRDLVSRYAVDGVHWDYIRYESTNAGYPTDLSFANSGLARFKRITGYADIPPSYGEPAWDDFRRREVTELVRRVRMEIASIRPLTGKPVRYTAAVIASSDPGSDFAYTGPYVYCYQDWAMWLQRGYLDAACPMLYDRDHCPNDADAHRRWIDAANLWKGPRHLYCGQATYLNDFEASRSQLLYARQSGAEGSVTYSYAGTRATETICDDKDPWTTDPAWFPYAAQAVFTPAAPVPPMPWRDPEVATEGSVFGRVVNASTGKPIDDAVVQVGGLPAVRTDGNGWYVITLVPAGRDGTHHTVTASHGEESREHTVLVLAGNVRRSDFMLGPLQPPMITESAANVTACPGDELALTIVPAGEELSFRWLRDGSDLSDDGHYSGTATDRLVIAAAGTEDLGAYTCAVSNSLGTAESTPAVIQLNETTALIDQPSAAGTRLHADVELSVTVSGTGLQYRWTKDGLALTDGLEINGAAGPVLRILNVTSADLGEYACRVSGACGLLESRAARVYLAFAPGDLDADGDLDLEDFGRLQRCLSGVGNAQREVACRPALLDEDGDVDADDLAVFMRCFSGPDVPARNVCSTW